MKRMMTIFKLLLLIPAFLFGLSSYAQKAEPVKGTVKAAIKVEQSAPSANTASWQIEKEIETSLGNQKPSAEIQKSPVAASQKKAADYVAKKQAFLKAEKAALDEKASFHGGILPEQTNKMASSPQNAWDIVLNVAINPTYRNYGIETDGNYIYTSTGGQNDVPTTHFAKYTLTGGFVSYFNIPGITVVLNDLCYDGQYWWGIEKSFPTRIHKLDLPNALLLQTITIPAITNGQHIAFDPNLYGGGGFYLGDSRNLYTIDMDGNNLLGPSTTFPTNGFGGYTNALGSAIDSYSNPGTTYLWITDQNTFSQGYKLEAFDVSNGLNGSWGPTHAMSDVSDPMYQCYGLTDTKIYAPGKLNLMGTYYATQNSPHSIYVYELAQTFVYPIDAGVKAILQPNSANTLGTTETVQITVRNYGSSPLANIPVQFSVDGVMSAVETIPGPIYPNIDINYTFTQTANLNFYGNHQVCAYALVPGDQYAGNDHKCKPVTKVLGEVVIYPEMLPKWTGTVQGNTGTPAYAITENSLMKWSAGGRMGAWAKFPLNSIPPGANVTDVKLYWYHTVSEGYPNYGLTKVNSDPVTASGFALWTDISTGYLYNPANIYSHNDLGWNIDNLGGTQILTDISAASAAGPNPWWAVGFHETESYNAYWDNPQWADGWNEPNKPYIVVKYDPILQHDVGVKDVLLAPFSLAGAPFVPQAIIKNYGSTDETFTVTMTGPGYSSTLTVSLISGAEDTVSFAAGTFPVGADVSFTCCATLATDINLSNQCKTKTTTFDATLTKAYGMIASPMSSTFQKGPVKFFLEHPDYITQIAVNTNTDYLSGGTWGKDPAGNDTWYGSEYYDPTNPLFNHGYLVKVDTATGAYTNVGFLGVNINGLSYDYTTSTLYGIGSIFNPVTGNYATTLYKINRTTGQAVLFANLGYTTGLGINLACNANGMLFFVDIAIDRFYAIDPFTYEKEIVGPTGVDFDYAPQDMEFDRATGKLYLAGYSYSLGGGLYKCDLATGTATLIKGFPGGLKITGFAIPYTPPVSPIDIGVMWLKYPKTGNLTNGEPVMVKIRNYSDSTAQPLDDFKISYQMGTGPVVTENWAQNGYGPFNPGEVIDYSFSTLLDLSSPGATYCFKVWVWNAPGDLIQVNDTTKKCVKNTACTMANTCYTDGVMETEICSYNTNGGCESTPPAYVPLTSGGVYCGTVWKIDTLRDTDWYTFTTVSEKTIRVVAKAEFGMDINIIALPCSGSPAIVTKLISKCYEDSLIYINLAAGSYAIVIAPDVNEYNIFCGSYNRYTMKFTLLPPRYCQPSNSSTVDEYISNVTVGTIINPTGHSAGGYADYTYLSTDMQVGLSYPITVMNPDYYGADQVVAYVDWNNNLLFTDAGEKFILPALPPINVLGLTAFGGNITVPAGTTPGPRTMRVRIINGYNDPCGLYTWSEAEDYTINVIAPEPPIPTIITTLGSLNDPCPGNKTVPVNVEFCDNIQQFSLIMVKPVGVKYMSYTNLNPLLNNGSFYIDTTATTVTATWTSVLTPVSVGTGKLFDVVFKFPAGLNQQITWDTTAHGSQYVNATHPNGLPALFIGGTFAFGNCSNLTGTTWYAHLTNGGVSAPIAMGSNACDSLSVVLKQGNVVVYTACPNAAGNFSFTNLAEGNYILTATSTKKWGGVNAADANAIMRNFVHLNNFYLTGIHLNAADVNGSPVSNPIGTSLDALLVTKRFVGLIPTFLAGTYNGVVVPLPGRGDWASEAWPITVTGTANQVKDIYMLCTGDVNGTYTPYPAFPPKSSVSLNNDVSINAQNGVIDLPIYAKNAMNVASVSLVLSYPSNLQILDVMIKNDAENLVYNASNGQLRIAWFSLDAMELKAGDVLATLKLKVSDLNGSAEFTNNNESVLTDGDGYTLENATLVIPKLVNTLNVDDYSLSNVPNPFNATTEIRFYLPQAGKISLKVYNVLGEEITTLVNGEQSAGNHAITFDGSTLPRGIYLYKLQAGDVTKVKTMVIAK